jgi:hypothetical protein
MLNNTSTGIRTFLSENQNYKTLTINNMIFNDSKRKAGGMGTG